MAPADASAPLRVEVVYSPKAGEVCCVSVNLPVGSTAQAAVQASQLSERFPELTDEGIAWSVWSKRCAPDQTLRDLDRVELCRPLQVDPKEARRLRYSAQRARKKA